jgi:hypothetical protein
MTMFDYSFGLDPHDEEHPDFNKGFKMPRKKVDHLTPETIKRLGKLVVQCDGFLSYGVGNEIVSDSMKLGCLEYGMKYLRAEIFKLYLELGGTDEWAGR